MIDQLPPKMHTKIQLELCPVIGLAGLCWSWTGTRNHGYGRVSYQGRTQGTHRVVYELLVGAITPGLELDHLCKNRPCCNPAHLEPVTRLENVRRAICPNGRCPQGHPLADPNLIVKRRPNGWTIHNCRVCAMDYHRGRRRQDDGPLRKKQPAAARRRQEILVAAEAAFQQVA
jgi:hypothetical protein